MHRIRGKLSYANVISTVCLFLLVGGSSAYAASQLGKESVGTNQLKKAAVTPAKLSSAAKAAMTGSTGPQGPKGATGAKGANGAKGATGATGAKGDVGPRGETGPKGDTGEPGNANVFTLSLGKQDFSLLGGQEFVASIPGTLAEWSEDGWQVQLVTPTATYAVPGAGAGATSEYQVFLREATPGVLDAVVNKTSGPGEAYTDVRITRTEANGFLQ